MIVGIVVEYNPFHNGHLYQIEKIKKELNPEYIVVVMSSNFSQRGMPCIVDKFRRTKMALHGGVDLVLELPFPLATSSAERFAESAVSSFIKSNIIDTICFGSEQNELKLMYDIANLLLEEPLTYSNMLKSYLKQNVSYPKARELSIESYLGNNIGEFLKQPNNILSIEYIKALIKYKSTIEAHSLKRKNSHYHDTEIYSSLASATAIRTSLLNQDYSTLEKAVPKIVFDEIVKEQVYPDINNLSSVLHYRLITSNVKKDYSIWDIPMNLIHSIYKETSTTLTYTDFANAITSKTYSKATVYRSLIRLLMNIQQSDMESLEKINWIPYLRVLGCRKQSLELISILHKKASVPIIISSNKISELDSLGQMLFKYEINASNLYYLCLNQIYNYNMDYKQKFIVC
ncbi:hypothetical protein AN396_00875 [Candidatus Epulonipiscium fishelsonii]|uniref:Uncharacterized protein n=1 Tax=Candidatus Epulonipiscium fishelsonii TaxID=77094 RepID=A0ACC8XDF5_9FIRM|nr:hypothetical protein AN396_00875 [Epulopiscium sp. SCG-B11WGA-EpuloA1]